MFDNMNILLDQIDIDKGGIPFYTQKNSDLINSKKLLQVTQVVVTTKQDSNELITFDGPSYHQMDNKVLESTLIYIMMFTS